MLFGYLDPITGSALLQVLLGALAAAGLGWQYIRKGTRTFWGRFRNVEESAVEPVKSEHETQPS